MADRIAAWEDKAQLRSFLGWVYRDQGRHDAAIAQLKTALTDWDRAGLLRRKAGALNNLGVINTIVGRLDDALGYLESAFMLIDDAERPVGSVVVRNNRVHVYYRQGRFDESHRPLAPGSLRRLSNASGRRSRSTAMSPRAQPGECRIVPRPAAHTYPRPSSPPPR
ncbi:tetratricopeptide repeat protein [Nonomuraea sp. NPDC050153]|uniref:tetratricopeptide repeat protein n=1 Tax=Nonomuraea sp. NPDC050153 TaxID=3364359 RepID=UPI00378EA1E8